MGRRECRRVVIDGLDPAIHLLRKKTSCEDGWMPGSSPGMTSVFCLHTNLDFKQQPLFAATASRSRRMCCARFGLLVPPSAIRGRRECRMPDAPAASCALWVVSMHTSIHSESPESPGIPRAMVYGLYRALPGDRLSCHRHLRKPGSSAPGWADLPSARLDAGVEASGPHVFAVREQHRSSACRSSLTGNPPCDPLHTRRCRVHRNPPQRSRRWPTPL